MSNRIARLGLSVAICALLATSCASPAGKVTVLESSTVGLQPGATYAWPAVDAAARQAADPRVANDIIETRLRTAIDTAMAAKGFRKVDDPSQAQLAVTYHVGLERRSETEVTSFGGGGGAVCGFRGCVAGWGMYGPPQVDVRNINYTQGTLILDLIDAKSGKLAWRATSDKRVDSGDASQAGLDAILIDMTKTLPGPAAG